jgi:alpha-tubulin suppressor-like RCC1 family protein
LNIIEIICCSYHSLALTQSGEVYACASNEFGEIGCGDYSFVISVPKNEGFE